MAYPDPVDVLQRRVERYLEHTKMSDTAFSMAVANHPSLLSRMRQGKIGFDVYRKVMAWLDEQGAK